MFIPYAGGVAVQDVREYARVFHEIDGERRELAAFAVRRTPLQEECGAELARHKDRLRDLAELEELMMIRTRYVDFGPHWRAHRVFQRFLSTAESRAELLFCSDWLRQHEFAADTEFRQWLGRCCAPAKEGTPEKKGECCDSLFRMSPERILLTVKMPLF